MITVINATNRPQNKTQVFSKLYFQLLESKGVEASYLTLEELPQLISSSDMYDTSKNIFKQVVDKYILPAEKLVFVLPEYNGSYPGILKLFIDGCKPADFKNKRIAFVGVSSGRSGNLRGMDHLTNAFQYLGMYILPFKVPISSISNLIKDNTCTDPVTVAAITKQIEMLIEF